MHKRNLTLQLTVNMSLVETNWEDTLPQQGYGSWVVLKQTQMKLNTEQNSLMARSVNI